MARIKKVEIWVHFENGEVEKRYFETCRNKEEAETVISIQNKQHKWDVNDGYAPFKGFYTIEPYGTKKTIGEIVFR